MKRYFIDVNLPRNFSLWNSEEYEHVVEINDEWKDSEIWSYAKGSRNNTFPEFEPRFGSDCADLREQNRRRSKAYVEDFASEDRFKVA